MKSSSRVLAPLAFFLLAMTAAANAQPAAPSPTPAPSVSPAAQASATPALVATPAAKPVAASTQKPNQILLTGKVRAYDFGRLNRVQNGSNPNRNAKGFSVLPHVDYRVGDSNFHVGYSYGASSGFGLNGPNPIKNGKVDNTLPGFPLDQPVHELFVRYKDKSNQVTVGTQELNYAWEPNSDSRLLPASYEGVDAQVKIVDNLVANVTRIIRFEHRTSSDFDPNTLLTAAYPGASLDHYHPFTPGVLRVGLTYAPTKRFSISAENDNFYNISNLEYFEAKYAPAPQTKTNPTMAVQVVAENAAGTKQVGVVQNHTIGAQVGANVVKNLVFTASGDFAPPAYADVVATSAAKAGAGYFIGGGGTGDEVKIGTNLYRVAFGGIASPYTDSLATDPLYTDSITQGMADRRSAGNAYKAAFTYTSPTKQFKLITSEAWYQYSNDISRNLTSEFNADGTYYLNKVRAGAYKGFFVRVRLAPRNQPTLPYRFEYQRLMTEYDF